MSLYRIVYRSKAAVKLSDDDIQQLALKAKSKRDKLEITGNLIHADGFFMEAIEGEEMAVKSLYFEKIIHDPNNLRSKIILEGYIEKRDFSNWGFGPEKLDEYAIRFHVERLHGNRHLDLVYNLLNYFHETGEATLRNFWNSSKERSEIAHRLEKNY